MPEPCWLGGCDRPVSTDLRDAPVRLCHQHASDVVERYRHTIIAAEQLRQLRAEQATTAREDARQGNPGGDPFVYYARIGDYIKIGFSTRLRNRLRSLRVDELLAVEPGGPELERQRHREFADARIDLRRENFRMAPTLLAHIATTRQRHGLPVWATRPRTTEITIRKGIR